MNMSIDIRNHISQMRSLTSKNNQHLLLDLFCCAGGATKGYQDAGFIVVGIDIEPQPRYVGDYFIQMDALACEFLKVFDLIHASPPCQQYSVASALARKQGKVYPDLIHPTRRMLIASGKPYIMENVVPAPLYADICLDGTMFNIGVIRRRIFETNINYMPVYPKPSSINGSVIEGDYVTVAGNGGGDGSHLKADWEKAMGINWMLKSELAESIPPAYTEWIGNEALLRLDNELKPIPASNPRMLFIEKVLPIQNPLFDNLYQFDKKAGAS
ncbi:MAG: hypothetical protein AAF846_22335 [Chloroflexota bacterium]